LTLTPERAIEMLEQLRPYVVLYDWEEVTDEYGKIEEYVRRRVYDNTAHFSVYMSYVRNEEVWNVGFINLRCASICSGEYPTAELAMQAVDAHLATLPNVLALGVEPKGEMKCLLTSRL